MSEDDGIHPYVSRHVEIHTLRIGDKWYELRDPQRGYVTEQQVRCNHTFIRTSPESLICMDCNVKLSLQEEEDDFQ
jgi:hypothetical protein